MSEKKLHIHVIDLLNFVFYNLPQCLENIYN
jgi:hypothetical protein